MPSFDDIFPDIPRRVGAEFDFVSDEDLNWFVGTAISSGTAAVLDTNLAGNAGVLRLANATTTDDSGYQIQVDAETVQLDGGGDVRAVARVAISDADQSDFLFGFAIADTTLVGSAPSDGVYISKSDGSAIGSLVVRSGSSTVVSEALDLTFVDSTYVDLALQIHSHDGASGVVEVYADGQLLISNSTTTLPTSEALALSVAWQSGQAAAMTCDVDFLGFSIERD